MKAHTMLLTSPNAPLTYKDVTLPALKPGETLIQLCASGICGSDDYMRKGKDPRTPYPIVLGHEVVGKVIELTTSLVDYEGKNVSKGDTILINRGISCQTCHFCLTDQSYLCTRRKIYGINMIHDAENPLTGGYSNYMILKEHTDVYLIEPHYDPKRMVSAACSGATMAHAIKAAGDLSNKTVLIHGSGPLGLYGVLFAKDRNALHIIHIGSRENRLEIASSFGAHHLFDYKKTTQDERYKAIMDITSQLGVDVIIEATGNKSAFEEDMKLLKRGGHYLLTGYSQPSGEANVDLYLDVVHKNIKIEGIWVSDKHHVFMAVDLTKRYYDLFAPFVSKAYPLSEVNEALNALKEEDAIKLCIDHSL